MPFGSMVSACTFSLYGTIILILLKILKLHLKFDSYFLLEVNKLTSRTNAIISISNPQYQRGSERITIAPF